MCLFNLWHNGGHFLAKVHVQFVFVGLKKKKKGEAGNNRDNLTQLLNQRCSAFKTEWLTVSHWDNLPSFLPSFTRPVFECFILGQSRTLSAAGNVCITSRFCWACYKHEAQITISLSQSRNMQNYHQQLCSVSFESEAESEPENLETWRQHKALSCFHCSLCGWKVWG